MTATQKLLDFIVSKKLDLEDYPTLETPLRDKFVITQNGKEATKQLLDTVIHWEEHISIYDSLEKTLNQTYKIAVR